MKATIFMCSYGVQGPVIQIRCLQLAPSQRL